MPTPLNSLKKSAIAVLTQYQVDSKFAQAAIDLINNPGVEQSRSQPNFPGMSPGMNAALGRRQMNSQPRMGQGPPMNQNNLRNPPHQSQYPMSIPYSPGMINSGKPMRTGPPNYPALVTPANKRIVNEGCQINLVCYCWPNISSKKTTQF